MRITKMQNIKSLSIFNIGGGDPYYRVLGYKKGSFLKVRNISFNTSVNFYRKIKS